MATLDKNILCKKLEFKFNQIDIKTTVDFIMSEFKKSKKKEIIIVNIGTDKCTGDSFAPFLGSYLEDKDYSIKFYGTLENPIHALNIHEELDVIKNTHKGAFIIGLDSAMSSACDVGNVTIRNKPIEAGAGVGKDLPSVGDVSIIYNTINSDSGFWGLSRDVRLGDILKAVKEVYKVFVELENVYMNSNINLKNAI